MSQDYSSHSVALQRLVQQLQQALRDKRWSEADRCASEAMKRLARIHGFISAQQKLGLG